MRVIPVIDLRAGHVMQAVAGRRSEYQPLHSALVDTSDVVGVARALHERCGFRETYLADLDAITGAAPSFATYAALKNLGLRLWVDAGVTQWRDAVALADSGIETIVIGLETVDGPDTVRTICDRLGPQRVAFSLDLMNGAPLGEIRRWAQPNPLSIARQAIACGVRSLVVLDLARVGCDAGTGTEELCKELACEHPDVTILAGGGIRGPADLLRLRQCGVRAALVASALHHGHLGPENVLGEAFSAPPRAFLR
jgi:phosphoribosylformimino-5-aminoimidazole carboxamide ribotide isomerase